MGQTTSRSIRIGRDLVKWYGRNARDLPWRRDPDPYRVWISEIMLQQTTVATAGPYFTRFIERFPTVKALAGAGEQEVLSLWSGLGYYHRARNLLKTARIIMKRHGGTVPSDETLLLVLPGIGPYTAAAIMSIGFNHEAVALDANILRVAARLDAIPGDPRGAATRRSIEAAALRMIPAGRASVFNQALMDLGATMCAARDPRCAGCPVVRGCMAHARGLVDSIPPRVKRTRTVSVDLAALAIRRGEECLLMPRAGERLMKGMWEFPLIAERDESAVRDAARLIGARIVSEIGQVRHTITNHRIRITVYEARKILGKVATSRAGDYTVSEPGGHLASSARAGTGRWIPLDGIASGRIDVPLTGTARKIARMMTREGRRA